METYTLYAGEIDEAISNGGYGICLADGALVDISGAHGNPRWAADATPLSAQQGHTVLPIPGKTEEDERQDVETFCAWISTLSDTVLSPENKQKAIALARESGRVWDVMGAVDAMMQPVEKGYIPSFAGEYDSIDRKSEQFIITLNQQAPAGVRFVWDEKGG